METTTAPARSSSTGAPSKPAARGARPKRGRPRTTLPQPASREAKRLAAGILEVLAGVKTPTEAAAGLSVSIVRYYVLETRALAGFVQACEPRAKGPGHDPAREVARLQQQIQRLERDVRRYQALARAAQRAVGLSGLTAPKTSANPGPRRRRRKPVVRALRAVAQLRAGLEAPPASPPAAPGT